MKNLLSNKIVAIALYGMLSCNVLFSSDNEEISSGQRRARIETGNIKVEAKDEGKAFGVVDKSNEKKTRVKTGNIKAKAKNQGKAVGVVIGDVDI
jgi:hypothetical protein